MSPCLREVESAKDMGIRLPSGKTTVEQYMLNWLKDKELEVRWGTYRKYKWLVHQHVIPNLGDVQLEKLAPEHLQRLYTQLQVGPNRLSNRSILHMHLMLHSALDRALKWGKVQRNVTELVTPPRVTDTDKNIWTPDQLMKFLSHADNYRYGIVFYLAAMTGMRKAEICGLQWRDIDFHGKKLTVRQTLVYVAGKPTLQETKTTRSKRTISLDPITIEKLERHRRQQLQEKLRLGSAYEDNDFVIAREDGRPIYYRTMDNQWLKCIEEAGVPRIRFHDLRHTHASLLIAQGVPINVVSERLGHAQTSITLNIYAHSNDNQQRQAANTFASAIFGT
jgi:integrase